MRIKLKGVRYLGGYPELDKPSQTTVELTDDGVTFSVGWKPFQMPWDSITGISVDGTQQVRDRVTMTRMLAVGLFAFAATKKREEKTAYLVIERSDVEVIFEIEDVGPMELRARIQPALSKLSSEHAVTNMMIPEEAEVAVQPRATCGNGHNNPVGSKFCTACGTEIRASTCPNGHSVVPGAQFCPECGEMIDRDPTELDVESAGSDQVQSELENVRTLLVQARDALAAHHADNQRILKHNDDEIARSKVAREQFDQESKARMEAAHAIKNPKRMLQASREWREWSLSSHPDPANILPVDFKAGERLRIDQLEHRLLRDRLLLRLAELADGLSRGAAELTRLRRVQVERSKETLRHARENSSVEIGSPEWIAMIRRQGQSDQEFLDRYYEALGALGEAIDDAHAVEASKLHGDLRTLIEAPEPVDEEEKKVARSTLDAQILQERKLSAEFRGDRDELFDLGAG